MGQFNASLKVPGDRTSLPAVVDIEGGRLRVASGDHVIGNWALGEIDIKPSPEGVRVAAEGEVIILEMEERTAFREAALGNGKSGNGKSGRVKKAKVTRAKPAKTVTTTGEPTAKVSGLSGLDGALERLESRFGKLIPSWLFTRGGVALVAITLLVAVIFPAVISTILVIAGVIILVVGGVTMLDQVLAMRILPGRITSTHALLTGALVMFVGVLVGLIA